MVNETGNRNQISERCRFRFWLVHWIDPGSIGHNYACCQLTITDASSTVNMIFFTHHQLPITTSNHVATIVRTRLFSPQFYWHVTSVDRKFMVFSHQLSHNPGLMQRNFLLIFTDIWQVCQSIETQASSFHTTQMHGESITDGQTAFHKLIKENERRTGNFYDIKYITVSSALFLKINKHRKCYCKAYYSQ